MVCTPSGAGYRKITRAPDEVQGTKDTWTGSCWIFNKAPSVGVGVAPNFFSRLFSKALFGFTECNKLPDPDQTTTLGKGIYKEQKTVIRISYNIARAV
jgi:hypothetical protein